MNSNNLKEFKQGQYVTHSTDLAASLMACGVTPIKDCPCTNTYTGDRPFREGLPGKVLYHLERNSSTFIDDDGSYISADKLAGGFDSVDANQVFDELINQIEDNLLRRKIKAHLPLAIMSHHRAAMGNRQIIRKWWRKVTPFLYLKKGKKRFLISRESKTTKQKWGLKK